MSEFAGQVVVVTGAQGIRGPSPLSSRSVGPRWWDWTTRRAPTSRPCCSTRATATRSTRPHRRQLIVNVRRQHSGWVVIVHVGQPVVGGPVGVVGPFDQQPLGGQGAVGVTGDLAVGRANLEREDASSSSEPGQPATGPRPRRCPTAQRSRTTTTDPRRRHPRIPRSSLMAPPTVLADPSKLAEYTLMYNLLSLLGLPFGELFDLDSLAEHCRRTGKW
jgi:hypothetical protein